jgi:hypothetical protein
MKSILMVEECVEEREVRFQLSQLKTISALAGEMIHAWLLPHQLSPPFESVGWMMACWPTPAVAY